jgi:Fe-S-cluster-containing hydrogenase component 2
MGLKVNSVTRVTESQCIGCLECVAACPSRDALAVTLALPFPAVRVATTHPAEAAVPTSPAQGAMR